MRGTQDMVVAGPAQPELLGCVLQNGPIAAWRQAPVFVKRDVVPNTGARGSSYAGIELPAGDEKMAGPPSCCLSQPGPGPPRPAARRDRTRSGHPLSPTGTRLRRRNGSIFRAHGVLPPFRRPRVRVRRRGVYRHPPASRSIGSCRARQGRSIDGLARCRLARRCPCPPTTAKPADTPPAPPQRHEATKAARTTSSPQWWHRR